MNLRRRRATGTRFERLDERLLLSALTPAQVDFAYGLNSTSFLNGTIKGNGAGQTIAIVDGYADPTISSDLVAFDKLNGIANPVAGSAGTSVAKQATFSTLNLAGTSTNANWNMEEALDVEMAHAAAPGANLLLVEARSANPGDLLAAVRSARLIPGVSVISMSWGGPEFYGQQAADSVFTTPAGHTGITFLASSGDGGAGAQWPASSPNVVAVGGTSLVVNLLGARTSESAWSGSGGAISQVVAKPSYQKSTVAGNFRSVPDVAAVADPNTGVVIISQGRPIQVGGTSMSSPLWAGLIAIADQGLALSGKGTLDGPTQTLPDLYSAPSGSFFDVKTGPRASTGYDTSTGLGSPNAGVLINSLAGVTPVPVTPPGRAGGVSPPPTAPVKVLGGVGKVASPNAFSAPLTIEVPGVMSSASSADSPRSLVVANLVATGPSQAAGSPVIADEAFEAWGGSSSENFGLTMIRGVRRSLGAVRS